MPRHIVQLGRRWYPRGLWEGPSDRPWVALTIDDGPDPEMTPLVLDALKRARAPGTFFVVGDRAARAPDLVRRIQGEGHEVGNHTWSHRALGLGSSPWPLRQLERTEELLARLAAGSLRVFRPPYGAIGPGGAAALARTGLLPVYWSVVPGDWDPLTPEVVRQRVLAAAHPGAVVVLHGGRPWHLGTALCLETMIYDLRERGYEIVPLAQMLQAAGLTAEQR